MSNIYHIIRQEEPKLCGHCNEPILDFDGYHPSCAKAYLQKENMMLQKRKEQADIEKYGEVLSNTQRWARENPNQIAIGFSETYNQMLARLEDENKQEYFKKCAAREDRKLRLLPAAESRLKWLKGQVMRDEIEEKEELENAKLREGNTN